MGLFDFLDDLEDLMKTLGAAFRDILKTIIQMIGVVIEIITSILPALEYLVGFLPIAIILVFIATTFVFVVF